MTIAFVVLKRWPISATPKWTQAMRGAHLPEIVLGNKVVIGLAYGRLNWKPRRLLTLHPRLLPWLSPSGTWRKRGWVRFKVPISTSPSQIQSAVDKTAAERADVLEDNRAVSGETLVEGDAVADASGENKRTPRSSRRASSGVSRGYEPRSCRGPLLAGDFVAR